MENVIYAEQVLHGYANGHQLLSSSCALELADRKKMDELSDLSGRHSGEEFVDYYTGYPIEDGKKYVVAKTWYAYEMARPGCVWTHSLILRTEELCRISNIPNLLNCFERPDSSNYEAYTQPISLLAGETKCFPPYDRQRLQYEIFTICSSPVPKCILVDPASMRFENELFMVLSSLPEEILRTFTFCTMSYDVRKYGDFIFQYQMIPEAEKSTLARNQAHILACKDFCSIKKYPYWIQCYISALLQNTLEPLYAFIRQYGADYMTLENYSQFSRLYFALTSETKISLMEYADSIDTLFPPDCSVLQKTAELILDDSFFPNLFSRQEYMILEIMEMKRISLKIPHKKKLRRKIIRESPEQIYPYLTRYIAGTLPAHICELLEDIIQALPPSALHEVSCMDQNICFVLIRKNPNLLLCPDIWRQPRDFQQEMIYAVNQVLSPDQLTNLLITILQVDTENIAEDLYRRFGTQILPALYHALRSADLLPEGQLDIWLPILLKDQSILLGEILNLPGSVKWRQGLFLKLDINAGGLAQSVKKDTWLKLYCEFFTIGLPHKDRIDTAIQFFPAIFCTDYHFEDEFIQNVVGPVYQEVKADMIDFDTWNRFQCILPQVEDYQAWDRCLRIRRALEEKEYSVSLVER